MIKRKYNKHLNPDYLRGAICAAELAGEMEKDRTNVYLLEDRILCRLNIISKRQMRKYKKY